MDGNPPRLEGNDGLAETDPPLDESDNVNQDDLGTPGDLALFPGTSQTLEEEAELYSTDPTYFSDPLGTSDIEAAQHGFFESSRQTLGSSPISGSDLSPSSSFYSRSLGSASPTQHLPAVDPSAILSPEHAGRGYPPYPVLQPVKRGPGRPRKDGQSPIPRKRSGRARVFGAGRGSRSFSGERAPRARGTGRRGRPSSVHSLSYRRALQSQAAQYSPERLGRPPSLIRNIPSQRMDTLEGGDEARLLGTSLPVNLEARLSEGPSTSIEEPVEQGPTHLCAFCGCGERSLLGQGEINRYEPTPGFNPFKRVLQKLRKGSGELDEKGREKSSKPLTWRRRRGPPKEGRERSRSPRQSSLEEEGLISQTSDELSQVGFAEDVEITHVFEASGHVWAHDCCAVWSEGVSPTEDHLQFVDRAVISGLSQKCSYCRRYGATISCRGPRCQKRFHFPCASAGGCFQEMKSKSLLCNDHLDQAETLGGMESLCVQCGTTGNVAEQLFCTTCGHHYHGNCLCPPVEVKPTVRAGWQCPNCKICQTCRHPGDDCKMLVCDLCDKGYHTFCLKPAMTTIPKNGWKCKNCRMCTDCGARTPGNGPSSRWHLNYSVCDSCYQQRNKGLCCPLCGKAYRHFDNKQMVQCNSCKKYVHSDCDSSIDSSLLTRLKDTGHTDYICTVCRAQEDTDIDLLPIPPSLTTEESLEGYPSRDTDYGMKDDQYMHDTSLTAASSQESLYYEDSSSSMDVELGITDKPVSQLTSPSGLASYMQAKAEMLESHRGKLPVGRKRIGAGRPRTRPLVPEKKREKRRGPKVKIKTGQLGSIGQGSSRVETDSSKDDSGDDHPATIVLTSSKDHYVLDQDICKSCGAFGKDEEGRLISCTQCGQSYHPYCANVKVTKVILQKGWRCLDCTVCEGCGSPKDEGRLLLCDDCDISYHTYCLDPPLEHVPKGTWKCKWCVCCQHCGSTSPGFCCTWQNNYNQCGPCYSKQVCPVCRIRYREEELIIQCVQCDRWLHAFCDGIKCEDDAERAADYGYHCLYCRPKTGHPGPLPPPPPPPPPPEEKELKPLSPPMLSVPKEPEVPKQFLMDGVYLSASGIQQIQSLTVSMPKKTRQRRIGKKLDKAIDPHSKHPNVARLLSMSSIEGDDNMDKDPEESKTPEPMEGMEPPLSVAAAALEGGESDEQVKKRRQRKQTGLGVGGFIPRQRTRTWKRQPSATEVTPEDGAGPSREGMEGAGLGVDGTPLPPEKVRKRRRPRAKSQLEENFPAYLQEAFFGRPLLDTCKDSKETLAGESDVEKDKSRSDSPTPGPSDKEDLNRSLRDDLGNQSLASHGTDDEIPLYEGDLKDILPPDLSDLPHDEDILNILETEDSLPIGSGSESGVDGGDTSRKSLDNLDSMLNPNLDDKLDSMLTDVVVPTLTQIDPKSVEDVFSGIMQEGRPVTGVPADSQFPVTQQPIPGHPLHHLSQQMQMRQGAGPPQSSIPLPGPGHLINTSQVPPLQMPHEPSLVLPPLQSPTGPVPDPSMSQQVPGMGTYGMGPLPFGAGPPQVSPNYNAGPNPAWALGQDDDQQEPSSRRNLLKWGGDEALGLNATISAVLYANTNHPNLKTDYPEWSERSKQIAKLWKKLTPDEKAPFLSKARKNRTSSRVQKAQKQVSQELHRRQQEAQKRHDCASMPPPPPPPPLPSPGGQGTMPGDPFMMPQQPLSPHGLEGRRPDMVGMMSPRHPGMHSPGRPMEGGHPMAPVHSPLHSPHGPMPRSPWGEEAFPGAARTVADPMMGPSPGPPRPAEAAGRPPPSSDPYAFQPSTPLPSDQFPDGHRPLSHPPRTPVSQPYDPYAQPPGTPRPMLEEDPYAKMPGTPAAIPQSRPYDPYSRQPMTPHPATSTASAPPRPPGDPYAQPPGTPRPAGVMDPFHQRPRLPPPNSPGGPMGGPRPGDPTMRPRQAAPDPYAFPPGTPRPGPEEGFNMPRPGMTHGLRQQMVQQLSPRMRHPSPEHFQQQPTSQAGDPYSQQPMTPHPGMPQSPQGGQSPHSTPLRHQDQPFPGRPPQQQLQRSQSLPDPFSQQPGGPPPDVAMSRTLSQLSPGGMLPLRGPRPPFMQEKPAHPESAMLQQLYSRRHSHLAAGPWPSSLSHTLLGEGMEGGDHGMRHQHLREMLAQQILKTKMRKQQEESEKIKGPQWPPQDGVPQSLPSNQPGVPPQFGMEMGPRPPPGFTEHGPNQERWAALRQRMIRPPNPEAEGFGPRGHMEMQPGFPGQMRGPRPPLPGMPHGFPPGTDPSQDPRMGSPGHGQFPPTSMAQESRAQLLQALQEQGAAAQGNIPPGQAIQHQMQVKATSAGAGFPQQTSEGVPSMALHHPGASPGQAQPGQFPGSGQKMPVPGSTQIMPPFSRQASQPGTAQSEEDLFRQTPLTSARDPMISETNLKQGGVGLDETSQSEPEHLQLSDIELKVTKQSMSSEDEKHEDDDLLNDDGTFDILKFADPELGSDEDKFLDELDLMDESNKLEETKTEQVPKTEAGAVIQTPKPEPGTGETPAAPGDEERKDKDGEDQSGDQKAIPATDFQAKFLEFSQKRQEQFAIDAARLAKDGKKDDKEKKAGGAKAGVSHIAALLQGTEPIGTRIEKSEIEKRLQAGVKIAEAGKPQTDPLGLGRVAIGPGMSPLQHGRSPMQGQHTPVHMSPSGSIGVPGQAPGTPGIPSPKFIPSPRSGQPSPRTPNVHSPFSQLPVHSPHSQPAISGGSQLSPFSTSVPSPFSPTVSSQSSFGSGLSSTPQSPFPQGAPPRPGQPGFPPNTPQGMLNQPPQTASHQQGQFPMHHPSRATMTPTNQYTQGTYGQQLNNAPPRGGTLTPTPSSILYGQSAASQHGMRMQGPGQRPLFHPTGGMPGEEGPQDPNRPLGPDGQPVSQAGIPGQSPSSIGQQLQSETAAEIAKLLNQGSMQASATGPKGMGMLLERPGMPPQSSLQQQLAHGHPSLGPRGMPPGFGGPGQPRMPHPGMRMPGPRMPGFQGAGPGMMRPPPPQHKEQATLLDELLEQEKQEQKRQAEQQAMIHRREMVGKPEGMIPPGMRPGLHHKLGPRMEHPRMAGPGGEAAWSATQGGPHQGDLATSPQFQGFGPRPQGQLSPRTPSPFQATSPGMQPPRMSPLTMIPPPPQPPMPPPGGEVGPEYDRQQLQYEDWLTKQAQFLDMQIKLLEQQIAKQKRTKKSIQARQRQARKNGNELNPNDVAELERITTEQSGLQKQLEALRKQQRQHQMMVQDYRTKQKEQMGRTWLASPGSSQGMMSPQSSQASPVSTPSSVLPPSPITTTQASSTPPQTPPVRAPGANSVRLTRSDRQEYEAYMQNRLRMLSQQQGTQGMPLTGPRIRLPVPPGQIPGQVPPGTQAPASGGPPMPAAATPQGQGPPTPGQAGARLTTVLGDNNPFSEDFQQREQLERFREKNRAQIDGQKPAGTETAPPATPEALAAGPPQPGQPGLPGPKGPPGPVGPPAPPQQQQGLPQMQFFRERMGFEQGPRFPRAPGMFAGEGAPRPFEGPRPPAYPGTPGHPGPPGMFPQMPGSDQSRLPFPQGMHFQPGFGIPPTANLPPEMGSQGEKEKPKKRRKKKKAAETDNAQSQPLPPSIPTQAAVLGQSPAAAPPAQPVTTAPTASTPAQPQPTPPPPKVPDFPIKPQSETERRILEILQNTAALAQKEGDEQSSAGKSPRGKSPAAAASLPATASPLPAAPQPVQAPTPPGSVVQTGALQQPASDTSAVPSGPQVPAVSQIPSQNIAVPTQVQPPMSVQQPGPLQSAGGQGSESVPSESTAIAPDVQTGPASPGNSSAESNPSIPHLETQLSQSSAAAQGTYESPPHLQPQTDVGVEETASSQPTDPPVVSITVTAPSTTGSQPSTSEVKEKSSEEGSTAKPSEGAYDEPDGGSTVEGGDGPEEPKKKFVCDDGIHCGTDDEEEEEEKPQSTKEPAKAKFVCDDGIHCGTDDEDETPADKGSSESHPGQSTSSDQTTQGESEEKSSSEPSKPRQEETEASNVEVKTEPSETKPEEQKEKVELTKTPEVSISQSTAEPSTPTTSSSGEMSTVKAEGALSLVTKSTVQTPLSAQSRPSDASSISGQVPPVSKSDMPEVTGTVSKTEMTPTPSTPQNIVGQVLQRPPLPPGHPMFRQIHQQMMQDQMIRASQEQQIAVSKSGPEQAMSQTQRLPPSYASAIMANQSRQSPATLSSSAHAESTIPETDQNPKQEGHDQNIPLPNSSQPSRTLVSQLMQASIASSVSLPGNMMTLSSAVPSTPASPRLSHPTATTSITFSTDSQPVQPNPQNPNQMNDPRMRMSMSAAALQQHAAYVARMQGMHRMPGMVPQRMQSHSQAMPTMTMGQRMMGHSSPSQTTSPGIPVNTSPHSGAQVHPPQHSPEGLPRSLPQTQGLPAHIQGQPTRGPGQPQHPGQEAMPRPMLHGQGMPPHVPGQPPHSAAQNPGVPPTSIQGMPPRSAAPGMPPHSMQQGMHPHFPQRGMSPQEIMQRMAQGGMPPHMLQRMPQHMQGQRMPPHGMPRGMQQMPPGMQHNMHPGMPPHNLQGMPPNSAHLHPSAHGVQSQGLPPQAHGGLPHSGMHPGMPPHSNAQVMPPHSNAQGMQPLSTAPGMPPHSTAPGMPPHSTAPGMPPHSTAPGMPPHSTALGMPPHSAPAGNPPHSVGMGMPPHSIGTGMPRPGMPPHSTLPGMPPHSVPQGMPPHGAPGMSPHMMQRGPSPRAPGMPPHSTQGLPPHLSQAPTSQGQGRPTVPMPLQIPGQPISPHSTFSPGSQQTSTGQALSPLHLPSKQTPPATSPLAASATPPQAPSCVTTPPHSGGTPATTPLSSSQTSPAGSLSALAALSPSDSIKIKQEPSDDVPALPVTPGTSENPDLTPEEAALQAKQNALLKRLLSNSGAKKGQLNPQGEGDDIPELTPEQQQQLEMIDKMPIFRETEISSEEWESKTPEEREKILEMRRQEYERKRKEYEELRKAKRKTTPETGATEVKLKRRKKTEKDGVPKKRIRKQKGKESEIEARTESFLQQLRTLPPINLQEPPIGINNNIVPVLAANTHTADNQLRGSYAKAYIEGLPDFYGSLQHPNFPMGIRPPLGDIAARRRFLSDGQHVPFTGPFTDEQRYHLLSGGQGLPQRMPLLPGMMRPFFPALPPPPRIEPHLEPNARDTPDTIISSSSPEVGFGDTELELPALRPIDPALNEDERGTSPAVPLLHPVPIKPEIKDEKQDKKDDEPSKLDQDLSIGEKKERLFDPLQPGKETLTAKMPALTSSLARPFMDPSLDQQVSVTLTLSATAAEDIGGVISAIADLLKIAVPPTYEMTRSPSPETFKMNLTHKEEAVNIQSLIKAKPKFCRHCDVVVLSSGIRKKKTELPFLTKDDQVRRDSEDEEVTFCSMNCYMQFTITHQVPQQPTETEGGNLVEHKSGLTPSTSPRHIPVTSALSISTTPPITPQSSKDQPATPTTPLSSSTVSKSPMPSPALPSPPVKSKEEKAGKKHRRSSSTASDVQLPQFQPMKPLIKRWKDIRYQRWDLKMLETLGRNSPVPTKEIDSIWSRLDMIIYASSIEDSRKCSLCSETCDGETDSASRLLNMDVDKWVHLNCALWSYEVYETLNGALMNVDVAFKRGATIECVICGKLGATLSCFKARCVHTYHLPCAKAVNCLFFQDKTLLCPVHAPKGPVENELESLVVYRRVYINRDEDKQVASMIHQDEGSHTLRVGSLILHSIGQLLPHQIQTGRFHTKDYIFPVGFRTSRFYWSMRRLYKRCRYTCSISDNDGRPEFTIKVIEDGFEDAIYKEPTARDAWMHVLQPIEKIRKGADLVKMFPGFITGEELFGLTEPNILKVIESLPGTDLLGNYIFRYGRSPLIEMPLAINPTGCARTEPKLRTHFKRRPHTLQSSNSRSLPTTVTGVTGDVNSPYMKQFVHSKSQQYRRLKTEWKTNVFLARSGIQGLGLFAARDLEKHTMVIEYIGDLIRNEVANRRETVYEEQNRGVYMFRIDCDTVIDATMAGGPARYINHSCAPNCVAEVVPFEKESKIIIITSRRLAKGEELTYDYKFDFEDDQHKIPCNCGANGCRKWMN